jgi:hypothetical protein
MLDIALVGDEDRSKEKCRRRGLIGLVVVLLALSITFFALLVSNHVLLEKDEAPAPAKNDPAKHPGGIPDPVDPNPNPVNPVSTARAQRRAQLAVKIAASMDATAEPCDDFYQYVCGNYVKEHPIPNTQGGISSFSILGDSNEEFLKATFEGECFAVKYKHLFPSSFFVFVFVFPSSATQTRSSSRRRSKGRACVH